MNCDHVCCDIETILVRRMTSARIVYIPPPLGKDLLSPGVRVSIVTPCFELLEVHANDGGVTRAHHCTR